MSTRWSNQTIVNIERLEQFGRQSVLSSFCHNLSERSKATHVRATFCFATTADLQDSNSFDLLPHHHDAAARPIHRQSLASSFITLANCYE